MKAQLSRRDWFKSSLALTAGLTLSPMFVDKLFAGPVSAAERFQWGINPYSANGNIRLNANENPYGPSEKVKQAIIENMHESNRYPFQALSELKKMIADKEGVDTDHIHMGAGSGEILCEAGVAFGLDNGEILSGFPTFTEMMDYAKVFNAKWDKVNLNDKLEFDYGAMASRVNSKTKLVFICNPNNPTGTLVDPSIVSPFCQDISKKTLVYSDEAYLEFLEPEMQKRVSNIELVKKGMNVVVSRTFSKIHGLAGLRIGYIVAKPDLIKKISQYQMGIPISQHAIAAAKASLGDNEFMTLSRTKNTEARGHLEGYLKQKGFSYGKSHTNFMFFLAPKEGKAILSGMQQKNILMRIWDYKNKEWCRVSIGTLDEMKQFTQAFDEVIA
ncbi:MAG: histidinol-phosphate aminotransferase family protein [Cyclobacteriaceae bacterium]|nr:histidinol-phosphate aminotransferase family protein [Cyclobacteriaceae bacterium]